MTALIRRRSAPTRFRYGLVPSLVILAALTFACSSDDQTEPVPTLEPLSPAEVIARSSDALSGLTSFRFALSHDRGNTVLTNGIQVQRVTGTAVAPGSYTLNADTLVSGFFINTEVVVIDQDSYMTHPITHRWELLGPDASPFGTFDPTLLVANILDQVDAPAHAPPGSGKDGVYVIDGNLPPAALSSLTGGVDESAPPLAVRVTVDGATFLPVEARITGRATETESADLVRTVRLFEFDAGITVEPPI
ncbi:MAG: LppX_LprAFG lipoprotein [Chloroflexi bacterium]|nr:LppX_LprAFG lipoprotein [Chloroflexota bacterium]MCH8235061.1 LppX_LprAFG lipoprotein [Chloroflexota bacterium]MCH8816920.1 LppX_LprAFG lipoprotein [Chloroflexota bacterium]